MLIVYVDEFGNHTLDRDEAAGEPALRRGASQYFVLGYVGVRDTSRRALAERIMEVKEKHFGHSAAGGLPWADSEIKGRHLRRVARSVATGHHLDRPAAYRTLTTEKHTAALFKDIGLLFDTFRTLVFAAVVDKLEMIATGRELTPLGVAYAYLHQRVAATVGDFSSDAAMFVADQQSQHEKFFRSGGLRDARATLDRVLRRRPDYDLVLDKPLWVDTELSHWDREILQLADIVAYSAGAYLTRGGSPREQSYLWKQIRRCMALHQKTGLRLGAGFSLYASSARIPTGDAGDV